MGKRPKLTVPFIWFRVFIFILFIFYTCIVEGNHYSFCYAGNVLRIIITKKIYIEMKND